MKTLTTDALLLRAAREQDTIGVANFLFGRISRIWKDAQRMYLLRMYPTKNFSADAWAKRWISKIYRVVRNVWKFRCEHVHGIEKALTSKREQMHLKEEIRKQFDLGPDGVRSAEKGLFQKGKSEMLKASIREQKYWLRTIKISRAYVTEANSNMYVGMRYLMRTWTRPPD